MRSKKHADILYQNSQPEINTFLRFSISPQDILRIARSSWIIYSILYQGPFRSISVGLNDGAFFGFDLNTLTPDETSKLVRTCLEDKAVIVDDYYWATTLSNKHDDDYCPSVVFDLKHLAQVLCPNIEADRSLHLLANALIDAPDGDTAASLLLDPEYRVRSVAAVFQAITKTSTVCDAIEQAIELDNVAGNAYFMRREPLLLGCDPV